jgi:phosphatidylinositol alpha-mannosyltransferase
MRRGAPHRAVKAALAVVVVAAVTASVIGAGSRLGLSGVGHLLTTPRPGWVAVAVALAALALVARAVSWIAVLEAAMPRASISRLAVVRATMIGVMMSAALPGRLGEPTRAWLVARRTGSARASFSVVVGTLLSQTLLNAVALAALGVLALASLAGTGAQAVVAVVAGPLLLGGLAVVAPRLLRHTALHGPARLRGLAGKAVTELQSLRHGLVVFRRPRLAVPAVAAQLFAWMLQMLSCYAVLMALRLDGVAALGTAAAVLFAVNVTAIVPITPSNVGVFQAACIAVLSVYGVSQERGLAYGIALQAVEVATSLVLGLSAVAIEGLSLAELRRTASTVAATGVADAPADPDGPPR